MKEIQDNVNKTNARVIDLESTIRHVSTSISGIAETTIWATVAYLLKKEPADSFASHTWTKTHKDLIKLQTEFLMERREYSDFKQALIKLCHQFKSDIQHLDKQIKSINTDMSTRYSSSEAAHLFGSIQNPPLEEIETIKQNYQEVLGRLEQLNESIKAFSSSPTDGTPDGVEIGYLRFLSRPDLGVWAENDLRNLNYPFGVFLDIYSFLARVQCGYTLEDAASSMLKILDLNQKVKLTSDETTTLSSYMYMVPPILGKAGSGNSAIASTKNTFLPAFREKDDWENATRNGDVKHVIEDQM